MPPLNDPAWDRALAAHDRFRATVEVQSRSEPIPRERHRTSFPSTLLEEGPLPPRSAECPQPCSAAASPLRRDAGSRPARLRHVLRLACEWLLPSLRPCDSLSSVNPLPTMAAGRVVSSDAPQSAEQRSRLSQSVAACGLLLLSALVARQIGIRYRPDRSDTSRTFQGQRADRVSFALAELDLVEIFQAFEAPNVSARVQEKAA